MEVATDEHGFHRKVIISLSILVAAQGFLNHIEPDDGQQGKSHPVVDAGNCLGKQGAQEEADQGHQRLKSAEPHAAQGACLPGAALHGQSLADGDGKGIHTQAQSQQQQFSNTHKKINLRTDSHRSA